MQLLATIEQQFVDELAGLYDADEAKYIYFLLMADRKGWTKTDYLLHKQHALNESDITWLDTALQSLKTAVPIQYLLGYAWFMDMKLTVTDAVLIPRPETEELVNLIISHYNKHGGQPLRIIDIGTGSGCIAIALKKALPASTVYALDVSNEALRVARQNADSQSVAIEFINADILEWDTLLPAEQRFDIVVSNPPYITVDEQRHMHQNVLTHEPHLALFVENNAPLLFYEHITAFAQEHLCPQGSLYFEINRQYGAQVCELLQKKGLGDVTLHQDMHGADRMVHAKNLTNDHK